jgi:hypothetical protein
MLHFASVSKSWSDAQPGAGMGVFARIAVVLNERWTDTSFWLVKVCSRRSRSNSPRRWTSEDHGHTIGPAPGHVRIQPHQQMQVIVQDRKPRDGHREVFRKFLEPMFDPAFPVVNPFPEQESPAYAARHSVIPAGHWLLQCSRSVWMQTVGSKNRVTDFDHIMPTIQLSFTRRLALEDRCYRNPLCSMITLGTRRPEVWGAPGGAVG